MSDLKTKKKTRESSKIKEPPMYRVILLNDHYTAMEFVVLVLQEIFHKNSDEANRIMLSVHHSGSGIAGVFTKEVAETKVALVTQVSRDNGYPLRCTLEPI